MCNVTHIVRIVQGCARSLSSSSWIAYELLLHTCLEWQHLHMHWIMMDYVYAFEVQLVWQCQRFFKTTTTGLHCIALFLRPLGKHPQVESTRPVKPNHIWIPNFSMPVFKPTLQTHILQTIRATLPWKTLLKWTKTCKNKDKGKTKSKHRESPAMLAEWKQSPNWGRHIGHSWKAKLSKLSKCIMVLTSETTRTRARVCIIKFFATAPRLPVPLNSSSNFI